MVAAMMEMIEHPDRCLSMGKKAALKGRQENSWQDYGERNLKIFKQALNEKN